MSIFARVLALALALFATPALAQDTPGDFDFYVLSLSWSPSWCATSPSAGDSAQCEEQRGFIVHGLWPQFESGFPQDCGGDSISRADTRSVRDLTPDGGLVAHEWRKHGTCSGLSPRDYLATLRQATEAVTIPAILDGSARNQTLSADAIEAAFVAANPGLARGAIAVSCRGGRLDEVRICLTRDLAFRSCDEVDADGCTRPRLTVPAP